DGTFTYSDVVFLANNAGAAAGAMGIYPNPSNGRFTVDVTEVAISAGGEGELRLVDVHGREVWARTVTTDQLSLLIELYHPRAGTYLLTLLSDDGQAFTRRILIR
ncbi:MAG: T9SS type A sorting domain-containing protein, partial [Bacteroidota bacterium]